jgi:hypothetical protein
MSKGRFWITVAVVLLAGWIAGQATPAVVAMAPMVSDDLCWHPDMSRNLGIAEMPCDLR